MAVRSARLFVAFAITVFSVLDAFGQKPIVGNESKSDLFGSVSNDVYRSSFFGFELDLPKGWIRLDKQDVKTAQNIGVEGIKSNNSTVNKAIDDAVVSSIILLVYAKRPLGAIENAALEIGAQKQLSKYITAKMLVEATKSAYLKNPNTKVLSDLREEILAGRKFHTIEFELEILGQRVPLRLYVTVAKQYALTFALSSMDPLSMRILEDAFRSIRFHEKAQKTN
jgi:hypothetical protein